jgi:DNA-binding transcriptional LysR family regulator
MFDWNDIRLFLAVSRAGSALGAARALGLNQTTVTRRIDVLEHALGLTLFERLNRGYRLTEQGQALCGSVARMAEAAEEIRSLAEALSREVRGKIRITAPEVIFAHLVAPIVAEYREKYPEVLIEYDSSEVLVDLVSGEADIAFRSTEKSHDERLIAQKLAEMYWTAYCSRDYAARHGMPRSPAEVREHRVVAFGGVAAQRRGHLWFMSHVDPAKVAGHSNTVLNMASVLKAGLGVGILPCLLGDSEPTLVRCFAPAPELNATLWLLTSPEKRLIPRVARFVELAAQRVRNRRREWRSEAFRAS